LSTTTPNLGLIKPELTDPANITVMNENWDKIDNELKKQADATHYTYGTTDLTAGTSTLETGKLYFVYE
jgi:hypothetical protein